jgi:uncharacterized protein
MRHARVWVIAAASAMAVFLVGTVQVGWITSGASAAQAQPATGTPRPGIITVLTAASPLATPSAAGPAPTPASIIALPIASAGIPASSAGAGYPGTITVIGEGRVRVQPDVARVNVGVETVSPSVKSASDEARTTMDAVVKAIKALGVADKDIQTSSFNIFVERVPAQTGKTTAEEVRYHVSSSVNLTIRNLDNVSDVLDAAIGAGANNIYGVTFAVDDPTKAEGDARQKAVADAQRRAAELARLNGVTVGRVIGISEVIGSQPVASTGDLGLGAVAKGGGGAMQPGELELVMQLQTTYAMQ